VLLSNVYNWKLRENKLARVRPSKKQRIRLTSANANRCCVCKRKGVGLHLHHIDGNNANTIDDNLAVLCVEDHDHHHRPGEYQKARHTELTSDKLLEYKRSWEAFVVEANKETPTVIAVVNVFGDYEHIHAAKIIFQWPNEKVEFERVFHLLEGDFDYWTDEMISEVNSLGKNINFVMINEPLPVEYCPCCGSGFSNTVKEAFVLKKTDPNWSTQSILSIYINPEIPSLAISLGLPQKNLYSGSLHLCQGTHLHYTCNYYDERVEVKRRPSVRTQVTRLVQKIVSDFEPAHIFIGTGDHDTPELIDSFELPRVWETKSSKSRQKFPRKNTVGNSNLSGD
tara:strand:- start:8130 stop:9146 length:1017 start_codon:yes stop_codon:yes gene_type:complete